MDPSHLVLIDPWVAETHVPVPGEQPYKNVDCGEKFADSRKTHVENIITTKSQSLRLCGENFIYSGYNSVLINRGVAQPGSAPALGAGGRRFESSRPDYFEDSE